MKQPAKARQQGVSLALFNVRGRGLALGYVLALAGSGAVTLGLLPFRDHLTPLSKGFVYLLVVMLSAAAGGLWPGVIASIVSFLAFNYFFIPPYGTLLIDKPEDIGVLFVFLVLSILISALLARAQERAAAAGSTRAELELLQALSADLLALHASREGYEPILKRLVGSFGFKSGALFVEDGPNLSKRASAGSGPGEIKPSWDPSDPGRPPDRIPVLVGGRTVGLLVLNGERPPLSPSESRILRAFCDQVALTLEEDRLRAIETGSEALRKIDALRKALLAAVSHELRSPLAAIKATVTDLLSEDVSYDPEDAKESLGSILGETERLNALIANLLDMSRIEGGQLRAKVQDVDLEEVLGHSLERIRRLWPGVKVFLSVHSSPVVRADPIFLDRVASNLLENAARSTAEAGSGHVDVLVDSHEGRVWARIIDHGKGISYEGREQLFYPFYKLDERHPRLGAGLGLAITKGFLALMEGNIWVEDTPNGGATFVFSLPASGPAGPAGPPGSGDPG